jgi:hypothetical protein
MRNVWTMTIMELGEAWWAGMVLLVKASIGIVTYPAYWLYKKRGKL